MMRPLKTVFLLAGLCLLAACNGGYPEPASGSLPALDALKQAKKLSNNFMELTSSAFSVGEAIPARYTCDGDNISPPLSISGVSGRAKSLVLIFHDPDAPTKDWVHWTVWNLPVQTSELPAGGPLPAEATEGMTDFGRPGYGGPCPPSGRHRYIFELYAVGSELYLDASATRTEIEEAMAGMIIERSELLGYYERGG